MDTAQNPHTPSVTQLFESYKKRHNEATARYINNHPAQMSREHNTKEMILDRARAQPSKQKNITKQYEVLRQMANASGDHSNNVTKLNGVFNNNEVLQQVCS